MLALADAEQLREWRVVTFALYGLYGANEKPPVGG